MIYIVTTILVSHILLTAEADAAVVVNGHGTIRPCVKL